MLKDTRLFDSEYYVYVRNGKGGRETVKPHYRQERRTDCGTDQKHAQRGKRSGSMSTGMQIFTVSGAVCNGYIQGARKAD